MVFRGVPGTNNAIIGAVLTLCENAPMVKIVVVVKLVVEHAIVLVPRTWSWTLNVAGFCWQKAKALLLQKDVVCMEQFPRNG